MVALVVVLADDLPVGGDLVRVPGPAHEPLGGVRPDQGVQGAQVLGERGRRPGRVDEHPPVPHLGRQLDQAVAGLVERLDPLEARRHDHLPGEVVRPRVVRAGQRALGPGAALGQHLVPAVPAGVGERAHRPRPRTSAARRCRRPRGRAGSPGAPRRRRAGPRRGPGTASCRRRSGVAPRPARPGRCTPPRAASSTGRTGAAHGPARTGPAARSRWWSQVSPPRAMGQ